MEGAVVSVGAGTVKSLILKLGSILTDEALQLGGVRGEIQYIKDELESMSAFLSMLAQKEDCDDEVKVWMKQVREISYDAEDCIDKFNFHIDKHSGKGFASVVRKSTRLLRTLKARRQIATQIQELRRRTREVSERHLRYRAPADSTSSSDSLASYPRLQALHPEQIQPVGFDGSRDTIVNWLMNENQPRLAVISIVGFAGLGKTTLAKMAYESPVVTAGKFQCRAFVTVSQRYDIKLLFADILKQLNQVKNLIYRSAEIYEVLPQLMPLVQ
jgi:disease resistance protein RPM1